ncbi:MAG: hypothetical protein HYY52_07285 [Candidatus Melainabacteria bacterium]|nr:hypothetical protein [Candidatus Melainabacteria bacterium]
MKLFLIITLVLCFFTSFSFVLANDTSEVFRIEELIFGKSFSDLSINERLTKIEKSIFAKTSTAKTPAERIEIINNYLIPQDNETNLNNNNNIIQTTEINPEQFEELIYQLINEERNFMGLLPLVRDSIGEKVAREHASNLVRMGYLSFYNEENKSPDERYTLNGGTGATVEVIKGFDGDKEDLGDSKKIKLNELLARQLIQAISLHTDDSQILYSPYISHIGCSFSLSKDKKQFASVIEFITKGGEFEPLKPVLSFGEKLTISGKINPPFKFKAVSIAYFDNDYKTKINNRNNSNFDSEDLKPYFPPQDYIAFADTSKNNFIKILSGLGVIGAIGAAPFTGGASAILAPVLINSIQSGPPKEIPLKRGIKVNSKGEFSGNIELNSQNMSGLYFISVLAELSGLNFPIVVSRRTVRVNNPLGPVSYVQK